MRIVNATYEGYIGVQEGTGRSELFIDFDPAYQAGMRRILFFGRNGCGKSTVLNASTPFVSQGDDRTMTFLAGKPGRKIINYADGDRLVKCDIRVSSAGKASCFMFLDGDDKPGAGTEKGNIGEYNIAVAEHLGVTPDFFKIGRIGSRVNNFLDLKPAQRKSYIGRFMPEMEEWERMHKNVSKRVLLIRNNLRGMQVELERIEPRVDLDATMRRHINEQQRLREELSRIDTALGLAKGELASLSPIRQSLLEKVGVQDVASVFNPIKNQQNDAQAAYSHATAQTAKLIADRPSLAPFSSYDIAAAKSVEIGNTIAHGNGELTAIRANRLSVRSRLDAAINAETQAKTALRKATTSADQLVNMQASLPALNAQVDSLTEQASQVMGAPEDMTYERVKTVSDALQRLNSDIAEVRSAFPSSDMLDKARQHDMEELAIKSSAAARQSVLRDMRTSLDTAKSRITTIESQAAFHARFSGMHCSNPRCQYEAHISQFATASDELTAKHEEVIAIGERIRSTEVEISELVTTANAAKTVVALHARLRQYRPVLEAAGVWHLVGTTTAFFDMVADSASATNRKLDVETLLNAVRIRRDLAEAQRQLNSLNERISSLEQLQGAQIQLSESAARSTEAVTMLRSEVTVVDEDVTKREARLKSLEAAKKLVDQLATLYKTCITAEERIQALSDTAEELERLRDRWTEATNSIALNTDNKALTEVAMGEAETAVMNANARLQRRDEYESRIAEVQGKLFSAEAVAHASHPAKGAPIEFLRNFLDTTRNSVNNLLDIALQGEFRIGFVLNEKEFLIPVSKSSGLVIPDILEASDGQLALGKTILGLGLVQQTVKETNGYNIIAFDEIDGMLDREKNRERFAEIVDRITLELNIEQLMMISHNDNFAAAPAGLVLFPGHSMPVDDPSFLENKIILADFS